MHTTRGDIECGVFGCRDGGLSMPKLEQHRLVTRLLSSLVYLLFQLHRRFSTFTLHVEDKDALAELSGIAVPAEIQAECGKSFKEALLFTHRGLSGRRFLQISSYWKPGTSGYH